MSFTQTHGYSVQSGAQTPIAASTTYTSGGRADLDEAAVPIAANTLVGWSVPYADVKAFMLLSDGALTIKTNSSSSPSNTLTTVANVPYVWTSDSADTFKITADVTKLYVTNGTAATVRLQILCLYDVTH